jgi:hypothetical protein
MRNKPLEEARKELSAATNDESKSIVTRRGGTYDDVKAKGISSAASTEKSKAIYNLLANAGFPLIRWKIGHQGTAVKYLDETFGVKVKLDYATTKSVYLLKDADGHFFQFSPPGGIKINNDGRLEGVFGKEEHILNNKDKKIPTPKKTNIKKGVIRFFIGITSPITIPIVLFIVAPIYLAYLTHTQIKDTKAHTKDTETRTKSDEEKAKQAKEEAKQAGLRRQLEPLVQSTDEIKEVEKNLFSPSAQSTKKDVTEQDLFSDDSSSNDSKIKPTQRH